MIRWVLVFLLLASCARDREQAVTDRLSEWFQIDANVYFQSKPRCTAAMYRLAEIEPKTSLSVQRGTASAKKAFREGTVAAIRMADYSPNDLADAMLLTDDGAFGKEALRAAARAGDCLRGTLVEGYLYVGLTRKGALLMYDRESQGLIVLDPVQSRLFYVAGDV